MPSVKPSSVQVDFALSSLDEEVDVVGVEVSDTPHDSPRDLASATKG